MKHHRGDIMDHASWMRHHRKEPITEDTSHTGNNLNAFRLLVDMDDVMEEASGRRHHVGIIKEEASGGHPWGGIIWGSSGESSGRHFGRPGPSGCPQGHLRGRSLKM
jgi:hypothetical protein